jgi:hypothetical protein
VRLLVQLAAALTWGEELEAEEGFTLLDICVELVDDLHPGLLFCLRAR